MRPSGGGLAVTVGGDGVERDVAGEGDRRALVVEVDADAVDAVGCRLARVVLAVPGQADVALARLAV